MRRTAALLALCLAASAHAQAPKEMDRSGFVDAGKTVSGLVLDMRYAGPENFVGKPIAGYAAPACLLTKQAAAALAKVQERLKPFGLGLKMFDCYRPARAVANFVAWARDPADQARKQTYYPNVDKSRLFELDYISDKSGHSRGSTVDLTLMDVKTGAELDMGSAFDMFDTVSHPMDGTVSGTARANRLLLQRVMMEQDFRPIASEWWHFTLNNEPYPKTYFDFVVAP